MTNANRHDMVVISMDIDALLVCARQSEMWWRQRGDAARFSGRSSSAMRYARHGGSSLQTTTAPTPTSSKHSSSADGLNEAALHTPPIGAAEVIERLCCSREARPWLTTLCRLPPIVECCKYAGATVLEVDDSEYMVPAFDTIFELLNILQPNSSGLRWRATERSRGGADHASSREEITCLASRPHVT